MSLNVPKVNLLLPNYVRCLICFVYQSVVQLKGDYITCSELYMAQHPMKHRITNTSCGSIRILRSASKQRMRLAEILIGGLRLQ